MEPMGRSIDVDGLVNARDLGGLRRRDGAVTPRGVFFRSENIDWVRPTGWDQLRALGVRTVVDLRQPAERARDVQARPPWLTTVTVDLDGPENTAFWKDYWDNGLCGTALYFIPHLVAMPERAVRVLSALAHAPAGGILFHCMSGRDRTGLISLLLLTAADAEPEEIVSDYTIWRPSAWVTSGPRPRRGRTPSRCARTSVPPEGRQPRGPSATPCGGLTWRGSTRPRTWTRAM